MIKNGTRLQSQALVHYVRLVIWPAPLIFDYGRNLPVPSWAAVLPQALLVLALVGTVAVGLARRSVLAFGGAATPLVIVPVALLTLGGSAAWEYIWVEAGQSVPLS